MLISSIIPLEPLILYFVLFFPGVYNLTIQGNPSPDGVIPFSILRELSRFLTYTIPSLALLWYLISDKKDFFVIKKEKPQLQDVLSFGIGLPGLIVISLAISTLVMFISPALGLAAPLKVEAPISLAGWLIMIISCLGTGYLEESYFRFYLLRILTPVVPNAVFRIIISTILFSVCHIYEGPWGILNAVLAGVLLSYLFIRFKSLHGVAFAHGAYNMFVYVMGNYVS